MQDLVEHYTPGRIRRMLPDVPLPLRDARGKRAARQAAQRGTGTGPPDDEMQVRRAARRGTVDLCGSDSGGREWRRGRRRSIPRGGATAVAHARRPHPTLCPAPCPLASPLGPAPQAVGLGGGYTLNVASVEAHPEEPSPQVRAGRQLEAALVTPCLATAARTLLAASPSGLGPTSANPATGSPALPGSTSPYRRGRRRVRLRTAASSFARRRRVGGWVGGQVGGWGGWCLPASLLHRRLHVCRGSFQPALGRPSAASPG